MECEMATLIATESRDTATVRRGGSCRRYSPHADVPAADPITGPYDNFARAFDAALRNQMLFATNCRFKEGASGTLPAGPPPPRSVTFDLDETEPSAAVHADASTPLTTAGRSPQHWRPAAAVRRCGARRGSG